MENIEIKLKFLVNPKFLNHKNHDPVDCIVLIYPSLVATVRKKMSNIFAKMTKSKNAKIESRVESSTIDR